MKNRREQPLQIQAGEDDQLRSSNGDNSGGAGGDELSPRAGLALI